jgi:pimeloyl-ACP methyl ester carboxylesterase
LIRFRATGAKIGSLLLNPGGPGGSGVQFAAGILSDLPSQLHERFDIVGFDPRGVGRSRPAVWCNSDTENDRERADPQVDYSPALTGRASSSWRTSAPPPLSKTWRQFGRPSATTS